MNEHQHSQSELDVLIMAGGTGGHVFPALAVAQEFMQRGRSVHWLGTQRGLEAKVVPANNLPISYLAVSGIRGKGLQKAIVAPLMLTRAVLQARGRLKQLRPKLALGMGGFASGPGGLAAKWLGIPLYIHEQNAVAGLTNRSLAPLAHAVMEAFPGSFGPRLRAVHTGNPVRASIHALAAPAARFHQRHDSPLRLLVLGGSQGAQVFNRVLPQAVAHLPAAMRPQVWHQCGREQYESCIEAYKKAGTEARVDAFIDDMAAAYEWADLVVARAGALTIAELCAAGLGAILVPFPYAVDDHQTKNAQAMVDAGAAQLVAQSKLNSQGLAQRLMALLQHRQSLLNMAEAARRLSIANSAARVVEVCLAQQEEAQHG